MKNMTRVLSTGPAEKVRAMVQRGNPRDLYDLWFIFSGLDTPLDSETVARLIPHKFACPLVSKGWRQQDLYTTIWTKEPERDTAFSVLVVDPPLYCCGEESTPDCEQGDGLHREIAAGAVAGAGMSVA